MRVFYAIVVVIALTLMPVNPAYGEAGVIIPLNIKDTPDSSILSLQHMHAGIQLNNQYATVRVMQIFKNKTGQDIEGKYVFSLPENAQVSAFAIWEDGVRIPAVIVEREKASELYEELTAMKIDPGLMEAGDTDEQNLFTVKVYPIPAHGSKRIELTYTTAVPVQSLQSQFSLPLRPSLYSQQAAGKFELDFELVSEVPVAGFEQQGSTLPLQLDEETEKRITGSYSGQNVVFSEDFAVRYQLAVQDSLLRVTTHRDPRDWQDLGPLSGGARFSDDSGYFAAQAVFNEKGGASSYEPLNVVLLVDTSASMQWTKLQACYAATEFFLKSLSSRDQFTLLTFDEEVNAFSESLVVANEDSIQEALRFFERSTLRGGTDLAAAMRKAVKIPAATQILLITDGAPTRGELRNTPVAEAVRNSLNNAKLMIFGIGNDARIDLLERLAADNRGHFAWASESENLEFKLARFFESLREPLVTGLQLTADKTDGIDAVYAGTTTSIFDRSNITWLGRYLEPATVTFSLNGTVEGQRLKLEQGIDLPEQNTANPELPRRWAQLRVDHLLREIDRSTSPEDVEKMINEIVFLSKKYTFATPYTSFLAAPRSLLRPRAMKAGDPILRVHTVEGIQAVTAHFPFGLTKALHYSSDENVWETRFLAPAWMNDGTYHVDIYLTGDDGTVYKEEKQFTVDSKPPTLRLELEQESYAPGQTVLVKVYADSDTRSIRVRLGNLMPADARWDPDMKANTARIVLPANLEAGTYQIKLSAVDFARNTAVLTEEIIVEDN